MKRLLTTLALTTALTTGAQAFDLSTMTDAERAAFGEEVRAYLMRNPQVIMEAVQQLEQQQQAQQAQADQSLVQVNAEALFNDGYSWVGGNPDGDIVLVEFLDYRCGYCRKAHSEVAQLLESDGDIKLIVKEFPILGEASVLSSRFAVAVRQIAGDEAYKQAHEALIAFTQDVNETTLRRLSNSLGLDTDAVMDRMNSDEVTAEIAETRALAQRLQISGTPTFVLQDELLRGYLPLDQMQAIVDAKRG